MLFNNDNNKILNTLNNVLITPDGFDLICFLLDELKAFERGNNFDNLSLNSANIAIRAKGQYLLELVLLSNFEKYIDVLKKRKEDLCQMNKI